MASVETNKRLLFYINLESFKIPCPKRADNDTVPYNSSNGDI